MRDEREKSKSKIRDSESFREIRKAERREKEIGNLILKVKEIGVKYKNPGFIMCKIDIFFKKKKYKLNINHCYLIYQLIYVKKFE